MTAGSSSSSSATEARPLLGEASAETVSRDAAEVPTAGPHETGSLPPPSLENASVAGPVPGGHSEVLGMPAGNQGNVPSAAASGYPGAPGSQVQGLPVSAFPSMYPGVPVSANFPTNFPVPGALPQHFSSVPPPGFPGASQGFPPGMFGPYPPPFPQGVFGGSQVPLLTPPAGTRVQLFFDEAGALNIIIPPAGFTSGSATFSALFLIFFACVWLTFLGTWFVGGIVAGAPFVFILFGMPFLAVGVALLFQGLRLFLLKEHIVVNQQSFVIVRDLLGWTSCVSGSRQAISYVDVKVTGHNNGEPMTNTVIAEGVTEHQFGYNLVRIEQQWIVSELARLLQVPIGVGPTVPGALGPPIPPAMVVQL